MNAPVVQTERIERLKKDLEMLRKTDVANVLTPKKRQLFYTGFAAAKFEQDTIYQIAYSFGRADTLERDLERLIGDLEKPEQD